MIDERFWWAFPLSAPPDEPVLAAPLFAARDGSVLIADLRAERFYGTTDEALVMAEERERFLRERSPGRRETVTLKRVAVSLPGPEIY